MKTNITYVEKQNSDFTSIKIDDDPYCGIIYTLGKVSVAEPEDDGGNATLTFDFKVDEVPPSFGKSKEEIENDPLFSEFIGEILVDILVEEEENYDKSPDSNITDDNDQ